MVSIKRLLKLSILSAILIVGLIPAVSYAQDLTPEAGPCDVYGSDASTVFQSVGQTFNTSPLPVSAIASAGIALAKLRLDYDELPAPSGCEKDQKQVVEVARLDEDVAFFTLSAEVDTANTGAYGTFLNNTWKPRFAAFKDSLTATPEAASSDATEEAAVCTNTAYQAQVVGGLKSMSTSLADAASTGASGLSVIELRYRIEDLIPPIGCAAAQKDVVQFLSLLEDQVIATMALIGDSADAQTYNGFLASVVIPNQRTVAAQMGIDLGLTPQGSSGS